MSGMHDGGAPHRCVIRDGSLVLAEDPQSNVICSCRAKLGLCRRLYQPPQGPPAPQRPLVVLVQPRVQSEYACRKLIFLGFEGKQEARLAMCKLSPKMISTASAGGTCGRCRVFRFNYYPPRGALDCDVATPQLKRAENPELTVARSLGVLR